MSAISGQLGATLLFDHFGAFGITPRPIDLTKLMAAALIVIGVVLIRR